MFHWLSLEAYILHDIITRKTKEGIFTGSRGNKQYAHPESVSNYKRSLQFLDQLWEISIVLWRLTEWDMKGRLKYFNSFFYLRQHQITLLIHRVQRKSLQHAQLTSSRISIIANSCTGTLGRILMSHQWTQWWVDKQVSQNLKTPKQDKNTLCKPGLRALYVLGRPGVLMLDWCRCQKNHRIVQTSNPEIIQESTLYW